MDRTLKTLLEAVERLDANAVSDRVAAFDALSEELPRLSRLSEEEWDAKLAEIEDDVADLGEQADRAVELHERAQRALETLVRMAVDRGTSRPGDRGERALPESDGRYRNEIAQAETTRDALLQVMARRPNRQWTPVMVHDDLRRFGRTVARSNVQVTLRRMAEDTDSSVRKVGRGAYQLVREPPASVTDARAQDSLIDAPMAETLRTLAEHAAERFLKAHPGEAEHDDLVQEAFRAVSGWTQRHGRAPDDEGHARRLMKSAIWGHVRSRRGTQGTRSDEGGAEQAAAEEVSELR